MKLLALVAVALLGCAPSAPPEVPRPQSPVQSALAATVFLKDAGCTGVRVGASRLVTAKHCVDDEAAAGDAFEGGVLLFISPSEDFVVVSLPFLGRDEFIPLRQAELAEHIYVVGYPVQLGSGKQELTVTDGIVAGPVNNYRMRITAPAYFGNSGGGVWADDGCLVGLAVAIMTARLPGVPWPLPFPGQTFMVPIEHVRPWL